MVAAAAYLHYGAPGLVRTEILKTLAQRYHRTARLDRVTLDPLRLHAEFDGFSLPDRDGRPMIAFQQLSATLSWTSLLRGQIHLNDLTLQTPRLRLIRRPDGRLNIEDLVPPPQKTDGKPLSLSIARFRLTNGRADLVDSLERTPFEKRFDNISFRLTDFATTTNGASYALSATSEAGERLSWRGVVGMAPLASRGRFDLAGWRADRLAALAPGALPFSLTSGVLDVSGSYEVALRGAALSLHLDVDQASLKSVSIRPNGATTDPVRAEALIVSGLRLDLSKRAVEIAHIVLSGPDVAAWRDRAGVLSLSAFSPPPAHSSGPAGPVWTVSAPDIRVEHGRASFEDRAAGGAAAWTMTPVDLTIAGFAYPIAAPIQITAHVETDDGSTFEAKGGLSLPKGSGETPSGSFDLALDGLELSRFQPYVSEAAKVRVAGGEASARGRLDLGPAGGARFVGTLAVDDLRAVDPTLNSDLVTWSRVEATGVVASNKPFSVKVDRVLAKGAYGRVVVEPNYEINIRAVLEQPGEAPGAATLDPKTTSAPKRAPTTSAAHVDLPIDIARIDFVDGRMDFTDLTVQPRFSAGIQNLNGSITGLSARDGRRAQVELKGGVDAFAPVTISGSLDPFAADRYLDVAMQFHNMELTTFSPYSGKFAGYRIDKGKLDVDLRYHIESEQLDATHHVVINQLQLGEKVDSADATKLPVKLVVALLKDKNGVIDLPVHVSGSLDDPKFKVWPVIWKVVGNLFQKVAASPFTLLGDLAGHGGGEGLGRIDFAPGSATLTPQEAEKLAALARALDQRPALMLEIPATAAPDLDRPVLTAAAYQEALQTAYRRIYKRADAPDLAQVLTTPKLKRKLLETAYSQTFGQAYSPQKSAAPGGKDPDLVMADALEAALRAHVSASDSEIAALAQQRAEAVETALVQAGHVDPKRLFVVSGTPLTAGPITMNLSLR